MYIYIYIYIYIFISNDLKQHFVLPFILLINLRFASCTRRLSKKRIALKKCVKSKNHLKIFLIKLCRILHKH